ncbi:hypothetical protein AKJ09_01918 [Labilithrix luteola]|uniref:Type IV fimbrial biogenesis protein PilY1 n=1 Tax=Labilithrix luteola TaxID=1391654 RepID=A0A0K1PQ76_9BACT|nr:hypothetical protein [Labilithrix luteola]AKU95254.1 hypothetical protein AKJ09_01918 [Labilithrix luteola]
MNRHALLGLAALTALTATGVLAACAADEQTSAGGDDAGTIVADRDAQVDAATDSGLDDAASAPCLPDTLCPGGPYDPSTPGGPLDLRTRINAIHGRSPSDVWAVGARGAIVHFDGTSWTRSDAATQKSFYAIWLRDSGEAAIASLLSVFTHGATDVDAGAGAPTPSPGGWREFDVTDAPGEAFGSTAMVSSIWAASSAEWAWLTTMEFPISPSVDPNINGLWRVRVDPTTNALQVANAFTPGVCSVSPCRQMTSIHGASADDLWAVGVTGALVHIEDAQSDAPTITPVDSQTWAGLNGVWAASKSDIWAVGGNGVIRHCAGAPDAWDVVTDVPTTDDLFAVSGTSATDVWAVGANATVLHYDGQHWSRVRVTGLAGRTPTLFAVWAPSPGHVLIGGEGVLLSYGGKP